jgi:hypothetical protein
MSPSHLATLQNRFLRLRRPFVRLRNPFAISRSPFATWRNHFLRLRRPFLRLRRPFLRLRRLFLRLRRLFLRLRRLFLRLRNLFANLRNVFVILGKASAKPPAAHFKTAGGTGESNNGTGKHGCFTLLKPFHQHRGSGHSPTWGQNGRPRAEQPARPPIVREGQDAIGTAF